MTALLVLLVAFPATRIANLPTGVLPEAGVWQVSISHRFWSPSSDSGLAGNPLNFITNANIRVTVERGITRTLSVGVNGGNASHDAGVFAVWKPWRRTIASAGAWTDIIQRSATSSWAWLGVGVPWTLAQRAHLLIQPRVSTNLDEFVVSVGAGALFRLPAGLSLGVETEPVLYGERDRLAWNVSLDKELGWHNFTLVAGNSWHQSVPQCFTRANRDISQGRFRVGFNILRRI